jgi:zinc protease
VQSFLEDEPVPGIEYEYDLYRQLAPGIQLEEVNRLAREWLTQDNRVVLVNAPAKEGIELPAETEMLAMFDAVKAMAVEPYEDAVADLPLMASIPPVAEIVSVETVAEVGVEAWELANGVTVILKPTDFQDDQIMFVGLSPGGTSLAPDENYIPAATAARVIYEGGVGEFTFVNLEKLLAGKNVGVRPFIQELTEGVSGQTSPKDIETLFQLTHLYFTQPRFDSTAFLAYKSWVDGVLKNQSADPQSVFRDTVRVTMAQHHLRARPFTSELLEELDLQASYDFYRDRFGDAGDFTFVFVGSFNTDSIRPLVQTYLGSLPATGREETWRDVGIDPPLGVLEKVVRKGLEPKSQTEIIFTGPIEDEREARYSLRAMSEALQLRLRETLREALGGTYSVSVGASASREPASEYSLRIAFGAAPERVDELVAVVFAHIDSLSASGPTASELARVKETQRRGRETSLRENGFWASQLISAARYGTDFRDILTFEQLIDGLTAEKIQDAARRYLRLDNYVRLTLLPEDRN